MKNIIIGLLLIDKIIGRACDNLQFEDTVTFESDEDRSIVRLYLDELGYETQRIIYDYENGIKFPKLENALKIAMALGVDLDSMFR
mgnify:CR=1 FL=1